MNSRILALVIAIEHSGCLTSSHLVLGFRVQTSGSPNTLVLMRGSVLLWAHPALKGIAQVLWLHLGLTNPHT